MIFLADSTLPKQASDIASEVDALYYFILWCSLAIFAIVVGAIVYFVVKYRNESVRDKLEKQVSHNFTIEFLWILIPTILVVIVFFWGATSFIEITSPRQYDKEIKVNASNWQFEFEYTEKDKDGVLQTFLVLDSLVVPQGEVIKLTMKADRNSFIHALYVPDFRLKRDITPGRYSYMHFKSDSIGTYGYYCTRYCGVGHSLMGGDVVVLPDSSDIWIDDYLNGVYDLGEVFVDCDKEGTICDGDEGWDSAMGNSKWDEGEEFEDAQNNKYDEGEELVLDRNGNGKFDTGYDYWVARQIAKNNEKDLLLGAPRGEWKYEAAKCVTCHSDGKPGNNANQGPSFVGLYGSTVYHTDGSSEIVDDDYIIESILYPGKKIVKGYSNQMPANYKDQLDDRDINGLVDYIKSLK